MTPIATPQIAPVASSAPVAPVQLQLGQILSGTVVALLNDATLRLQTPAGLFDIATDTPLPAGTHVAIAVQGTPQQPVLVITPTQNGAAPSAQPTDSSGEPGSSPLNVNSAATTSASANSFAASGTESVDLSRATVRAAPLLPQAALSAAAAILREAATTQGSLTTLYSNLEAVTTTLAAALPVPVLDAAKQLLAMRLDITSGQGIDAAAVKIALARSGLITGLPIAAASPQNAEASDLGTALIVLRQALKNWLDQESHPNTAAASQGPAPARSTVPMPPYRGAPSMPQAPTAPSLSAAAPPREQAIALLGQTDAAIARQALLRIVSLPGGHINGASHSNNSSSRLVVEIPVATAQGTGVASMTIERDSGKGGPHDTEPSWRASFSVDLETIGLVHVRIALTGERASVTLRAERVHSAALLSAGLPLLDAGLREAEIEPGDLRCHVGNLVLPRPQAATPGTFLDQAS